MALYHSPSIVKDGLILYLDAANKNSYPGSGNTWYDLSGNGKNGTLVNGTLKNNSNSGAMAFDGINDTISFGTGNTFFPLPQYTIDLWFRYFGTVPTTGTTPGLFGFTYGLRCYWNGSGFRYWVDNGTSGNFVDTPAITTSQWYHLSFYHTGSSMGIYVNGNLYVSAPATWSGATRWPTNTWNLGRDNNNGYQFFWGEIATYSMYNSVISSENVKQNFNALRGRYGI